MLLVAESRGGFEPAYHVPLDAAANVKVLALEISRVTTHLSLGGGHTLADEMPLPPALVPTILDFSIEKDLSLQRMSASDIGGRRLVEWLGMESRVGKVWDIGENVGLHT